MKTEFLTINRYERTYLQVKILLFMGLTRGVTSSSTGEGRRSAVESAPWFKASEQGSSILPFATRVFIIFVIISDIQFSSWLSVRTDICDKASEEVMNLNYLLFIFYSYYYQSPACEGRAFLFTRAQSGSGTPLQ